MLSLSSIPELIIPELIIYSLVFIFLLIASISDLRKREVPDWLNYGSIGAGLGLNTLFSLIYSDYGFILRSLSGLAAFFVLAYVLFYTGQWGGGDSKALMGIGAMLGLNYNFTLLPVIIVLFINLLLVGALYGLIWTLALAVKNRKKFVREAKKIAKHRSMLRVKKVLTLAILAAILLLILPITITYKAFAGGLLLTAYLTYYVWILTKSVERACMQRYVKPTELTEGDWIVKDVIVNKKKITGPKDLGIEKKQIRKLIGLYRAGKIKKVLIKEGIPFVPSFFIAFIVTLIFGNVIALAI